MLSKVYHKLFLPEKLKEKLAQIPYFPVTVVEAPSGFGKTTAVREYLKEGLTNNAKKYWYTCLSTNPLVVWNGICDMFSQINSELAMNFKKLGFPTMESLMYISASLKVLNCEDDTYIVIDNYQIIKSDILQELISIFSMHGHTQLHIIFITQNLCKRVADSFHNNHIHSIGTTAFFFDIESTAKLFRMEGIRLSEEELDSVYNITEGWIAAIRLQIASYKQTGSFDYTADIDHLVETAIWNRLTQKQKTCLVSLSVMDSFTARQAALMLDEETLPDHIINMLKHNDFIRYYPRTKIYVMHSILQNYLRNQFFLYQSEIFQKGILHKAGECCVLEGDYSTAIQFFYEVGDYDAILSTPFDGIYITNRRERNIMELLIKVINKCPEEILSKYPYVIIRFSYLLRFEGVNETYNKLTRIIEYIIEHNPNGISKEELKLLKGEFMLLTSFTIYNNLQKVYEVQKEAYKLLGKQTRFKLNEMPYTMGGTSIVSMFWCKPGSLDETLVDMQRYLPQHNKLTRGQGTGADSALQAEIFLRGDDIQAEILCHKALYQARSKQEICICLCAEQVLARIAILRGDMESFNTALENIRDFSQKSTNLYILHMVDICLAVISVALNTTDMITNWFSDMETIGKKVYARAIPYVTILYSHLLMKEKRHAELLGMIDDVIIMSKDMNYIFPQVYSYIYKAEVYYSMGRELEALESLQEAFELAFPDKIYMPFAQSTYMKDLLAKANIYSVTQQNKIGEAPSSKVNIRILRVAEMLLRWKEDIDVIIKLSNNYHKGREIILKSVRQTKSPLTPRELEVALLAKNRMSHQEIAEKLFISKATVRTIMYNIYNKLGIHSRAELYKLDL